MSDFASALMVRVLADGMRRLGLVPPPGLDPEPGQGARLALDLKRTVVMAALEQGGLAALPRLGRGVPRVRREPMHQALVAAGDAAELFARWCRLERYLHSRHRVVVARVEWDAHGGRAVLHHAARSGPPPLVAEDLVVLGVLAALLEEAGATDVRAWVDGVPVLPEADAAALDAAARAGRTAGWALAWRGAVVRQVSATASPDGLADAVAEALATDAGWPPLACDAARQVTADLGRAWPVADLAAATGLSTRTLQRRLGDAGLTCSTVLREARSRAAAWWLMHTDAPVAEVGFVCGYADQPHFTRDFRHRVGAPPAAFRAAFGRVPGAGG